MAVNRTLTLTVAGAALVMGLSACSGGSHPGSTRSSAATPGAGPGGTSASPSGPAASTAPSDSSVPAASPGSSTGSTPALSPPGKAVLSSIVLSAADLPSGWKGSPYQEDPNTAQVNTQVAHCAGYQDTQPDQVALVHSQSFTQGSTTVDSEAISYKSHADVVSDRGASSKPKFKACYNSGLRAAVDKSLPTGASIVKIDTQVTPGSAGSPIAGTITTVVTIATSGGDVTVYSVDVLATGQLTQAQLDISSLGKPISVALTTQLAELLVKRVTRY